MDQARSKVPLPAPSPPAAGDRSAFRTIGVPYQRAKEEQASSPRQPFDVDPNAVDRGLRGHAATQNALADLLDSRGLIPRSPAPQEPDFDLAWERDGRVFVAEVKSLTPANEERQLRLGLGQVLRYRHLLARGGREVVPVLAVEREPAGAAAWLELCSDVGVRLVWPATMASLV